MDQNLKKSIVIMLKKFINKIEKGYCDNLTESQYQDLINGFTLLKDVEESIKINKKWMSFKLW